jgi:hypothetical protein
VTVKLGETLETAVWISGAESPEMIENFKQSAVEGLDLAAQQAKVTLGPTVWTIKKPGEDRVPPVPKWLERKIEEHGRRIAEVALADGTQSQPVQGPFLLVCERQVISVAPVFGKRSFLADLSQDDLHRLRRITKQQWARKYGTKGMLTDSECDAIIEETGPDAAYHAVMADSQTGRAH